MPNVIKGKITDKIRSAYLTQKRRKEFPSSYFLLPSERKFPYKDPETGAIHCGLTRAAITRAGQYKYQAVKEKAQAIYEKNCKKEVKKDLKEEIEEKPFTLLEKEPEGKEVFGAVLVPGQTDMDGHTFTEEEVRSACYTFNTCFAQAGYRHIFLLSNGEAKILESYILPTDLKLEDREWAKGTWMLRAEVIDPDLQKKVREGDLIGWSIGGVLFKEN